MIPRYLDRFFINIWFDIGIGSPEKYTRYVEMHIITRANVGPGKSKQMHD